MKTKITPNLFAKHIKITTPSPWVKKYAHLVPNGPILDVASGRGRHAIFFHSLGHPITAIDKNIASLAKLKKYKNSEIISADLETPTSIFSKSQPLHGRQFNGIIVVNYLYRPLIEDLLTALRPGGVLIYETFALGNELFSRPRNPSHLLKSEELINLVQGKLQIIAYEHGKTNKTEILGVKQRIVAINDLKNNKRSDKEPPSHSLDSNQ